MSRVDRGRLIKSELCYFQRKTSFKASGEHLKFLSKVLKKPHDVDLDDHSTSTALSELSSLFERISKMIKNADDGDLSYQKHIINNLTNELGLTSQGVRVKASDELLMNTFDDVIYRSNPNITFSEAFRIVGKTLRLREDTVKKRIYKILENS